jgi:hypothetical protein
LSKEKSIEQNTPELENAENLELRKAIEEVNSELNKLEEFFLHENQEVENSMESKKIFKTI